MIINYSTGQEVLHTFSGQPPLCEQDAEWIVEDYTRNGQLVPFVDFDHVTFTGASAGGPILGPFGPGGAKVVDMQQDGRILAVAAADDSTVNVWYGLGIFGETLSNSSTVCCVSRYMLALLTSVASLNPNDTFNAPNRRRAARFSPGGHLIAQL